MDSLIIPAGRISKTEKRADAVRLISAQRFCDYLPEVEEDGYSGQQSCLLWPHPADCLNCPEPFARMEATIAKWSFAHPDGLYRLESRRHGTRVHFIDEGRTKRTEEFPVVRTFLTNGREVRCKADW